MLLILYMEGFNVKKINFVRGIVLILVAGILTVSLSRLLLLKSEDGISQFQAFYKQKENTVDVLFLGSSHVYCDINTGVLWDEYGIASFDLGGAEAPSWSSYYHLKEALKTQKPKVIFFEVSIAALRPAEYPPEFWVEDNDYGMKWGEGRIKLLRENTEGSVFQRLLFPLSPMHGRYVELKENDFTNVNNSINYKGFDPREAVTSFETPDISQVTERVPCSQKAEDALRKIIALTKEENIPLVLFISPYVVKSEEQAVHNYVLDIGMQEGLSVIDFNLLYDELGMDFNTDMAEELHLNYSGNYKFSSYLGKLLSEQYSIPDRRGNENYRSWDVDAALQRIERTNLSLTQCSDVISYMNLASSDGYVNFVCFSDSVDGGIDENIKNNLLKMGISEAEIVADTAYIVKNGQVIKSGNDDFSLAIQEGNDGILFRKSQSEYGENIIELQIEANKITREYSNFIATYDTLHNQYVSCYGF